jgi:hypothetical protein
MIFHTPRAGLETNSVVRPFSCVNDSARDEKVASLPTFSCRNVEEKTLEK